MQRLSNVEWHLILHLNFEAREICAFRTLSRRIYNVLKNDTYILKLLKYRQRSFVHGVAVFPPETKLAGKKMCKGFASLMEAVSINTFQSPDGYRVFESAEHVHAICHAYTITANEDQFLNVCLFLENLLGRERCRFTHLYFRGRRCLKTNHSNTGGISDCCDFGVHRGHVMCLQLEKMCTYAFFVKDLKTYKTFSENYVCDSKKRRFAA